MGVVRDFVGATAAAIALTVGTAFGNPATASAAPLYPAPDPDGFYSPTGDPSVLAGSDTAAGDVLRSRQVPAPGFPLATVWQLQFRSTNSAGAPIAAVTTLLLPPGGGANRPIVSYQPFINALGLQCAPSHTLLSGNLLEAPTVTALLARGWAVAVPDHLGPTSAYGAARLGGQITLDGIRAVKRFGPAGLGGSPVGLAGYSGGGMASGWAAALAPSYAPELPLVGVAMGGVPVDIGQLAVDLGNTPNPSFGLGFAAAMGLEREYPDTFSLVDRLRPEGVTLRDQLANACTEQILDAGANKSYPQVATGPMDGDAATRAVLDANSLARVPEIPRVPVYEWHGSADEVPASLAQANARRYCAAGVPVQFDTIPDADHGSAILPGSLTAFAYLDGRFAGTPAPHNC